MTLALISCGSDSGDNTGAPATGGVQGSQSNGTVTQSVLVLDDEFEQAGSWILQQDPGAAVDLGIAEIAGGRMTLSSDSDINQCETVSAEHVLDASLGNYANFSVAFDELVLSNGEGSQVLLEVKAGSASVTVDLVGVAAFSTFKWQHRTTNYDFYPNETPFDLTFQYVEGFPSVFTNQIPAYFGTGNPLISSTAEPPAIKIHVSQCESSGHSTPSFSVERIQVFRLDVN